MLLESSAHAQAVQPEQRISRLESIQGIPHLSAIGSKVCGEWLAGEDPGRPVGVGYGYSVDGGVVWTNETGLPLQSSYTSTITPCAVYLGTDNGVHFLTNPNGMQYYRGTGFSPIVWNAPVTMESTNPDFSGFDLRAVASDPIVGCVYACATEQTAVGARDYTVLFARSLDNGATWSPLVPVSSPTCNGPSLVVGVDGTLYVTYVDYALGQVLLRRSSDHGATFSTPIAAATMLDNLAATPVGWIVPVTTGLRSYPYYRLGTTSFAPNFPALAIDRSAGPTRGNLYLTWADYADGTVAPPTATVGEREPNNGYAQATPVAAGNDIRGSMGSVDFGGSPDFFVFDGVAGQTLSFGGTASGSGTYCGLVEELPNGSTMFVASVALFDPQSPAIISAGGGVPKPAIVTLPHTGRYFLGLYPSTEAVSYTVRLRNYAVAPLSVSRDMRDIVLVRSVDGGATWSPKVRVNHDAAGADQAMPNVAVDGRGWVYVGWYDRRGSAFGDSVHAYAAVSKTVGLTFGPDLKLSTVASPWSGPETNLFPGELVGDRIAIAAGDDFGIVAWTDLRTWPLDSDIYAARIVDIATATNAVSDLTAEPLATGVRLRWIVNDARSISGLRVFRAVEDDPEEALGDADLLPSHEGVLEYVDTTAEPGRSYAYRLRVLSGGATDWLGPVTVRVPMRVTTLAWRAAGPNPFARRMSVTLAVPAAAEGSIRIYDVQGKEVRTLAEGRLEAGEQLLEWDGLDASGHSTAPGMYFLAAQVGSQSARMRVVRVP